MPTRNGPVENRGNQVIKHKQNLFREIIYKPKEESERGIIFPNNDPFLLHVGHEIVNFFIKRGISNTTNVLWNNAMSITNTLHLKNETNFKIFTIPPRSKVVIYKLVGRCDQYKVYVDKFFTRVYNLKMKCIGKQNPEGIEDCNVCPDNPNADATTIDGIVVLKNPPC